MEHDSEWFKAAWWDARREDKEFRGEVREAFVAGDVRLSKIEDWIAGEITTRAVLKQQRDIRRGHLRTVGSVVLGMATIAGVALPFILN